MCRASQGTMRTKTSLPTSEELRGRLPWEPFDPECVAILNRILATTLADIVITSDWKHSKNLRDMGDFYAAQGVITGPRGCTPSLRITDLTPHQQRASEIGHWLDCHPGIASWIAVDDLYMELAHFAWAQDPHAAICAPGLADHIITTLNAR